MSSRTTKTEWKLMPYHATDEMLKAMDECSTEGYDERLYAGHASSVYSAAWDAFQGQSQEPVAYSYISKITGAQGFSHHPMPRFVDAAHWDIVPLYAAPLQRKPGQAPPVGEVLNERGDVDWISFVPTSGTPLYTTPPQRKPLTDEEIKELYGEDDNFGMTKKYVVAFARAIEAAHGIKEK